MADIRCAVCGEPWDGGSVRDDARHGEGGSMMKWEARLFLAGAGCPCCEGDAPDTDPDRADDRALEFARAGLFSGDFEGAGVGRFLAVADGSARRPAWTRPEPVVLEGCAGCGVQVTVSPDDGKTLEWTGGRRVHSYGGGGGRVSYGDLYRPAELPTLSDWADERPSLFRPVGPVATIPPTEGTPAEIVGDPAVSELNGDDPAPGRYGPALVYCPGCVRRCDGRNCRNVIFERSELEAGDTYAPGSAFPDNRRSYMHPDILCVDCFEAIPNCCECGEAVGDADDLDDAGRCESCRPEETDPDDDDDDDDGPDPDTPDCSPPAVREFREIRNRIPDLASYRRGCGDPSGPFAYRFGYRGAEWLTGLPVVVGLAPVPDAPGQLLLAGILETAGSDGAA